MDLQLVHVVLISSGQISSSVPQLEHVTDSGIACLILVLPGHVNMGLTYPFCSCRPEGGGGGVSLFFAWSGRKRERGFSLFFSAVGAGGGGGPAPPPPPPHASAFTL